MGAGLALLATVLLVAVPMAVAADRAQLDYQLHCQGCHTADGSGHMGVPALKAQIGEFLRVRGGREYLVQVPGAALSALDDARLAAVLNWMLLRFSAADRADGFVPYEATEVARLRREPLREVAPVRRRLLAQRAADLAPITAAGVSP